MHHWGMRARELQETSQTVLLPLEDRLHRHYQPTRTVISCRAANMLWNHPSQITVQIATSWSHTIAVARKQRPHTSITNITAVTYPPEVAHAPRCYSHTQLVAR